LEPIIFDTYREMLGTIKSISHTGKVTQVIGLTIESNGPTMELGQICLLHNYKRTCSIRAEVVGFSIPSLEISVYITVSTPIS
jgi:flagellum-specific ATP synthase